MVLWDSQVGKKPVLERLGGGGVLVIWGGGAVKEHGRAGIGGFASHKLSASFHQVWIQNRGVNSGMAPA